ncbi:hypothetical protein EV198_0400 [Roseivirga ehrenbergii]|uniref:Uncharacterized protein n=1 Tax=Roseivirga ehrenbergii (strain DSM 102268 / JCM 13514 / KCTC 12282 / NCIMB 14502 / KMM 6017) TaxID=279360 RepID=A0A150X8L5_ROSEK|nr:hypothetical protein [Roseivirga ehrenbergii]KYG75069.1 hypothetical protein MB14_07700 [Roseivirga ehrenbergii]TCL13571.1 hypothetical protein EV198_0400 [Roseivirga ehrenbergii]
MKNEPNRFYSTFNSKKDKKEFQIRELGKDTFRGMGVSILYGNGESYGREVHSSPTTESDYDEHFTKELLRIKPAYIVEDFLDFHFKEYCNLPDYDPDLFCKHMRYVILDRVKRSNREPYIEIVSNWIANTQDTLNSIGSQVIIDGFTSDEILTISHNLDELLLRISKLELGQEIIYQDVVEQIEELKQLSHKMKKKTWVDLLKRKLISFGLGKLTEQGFSLITSIFGDNKLLGKGDIF